MSRRETIKEKRSWLKNFFAHRQHPIMILSYTTKYMWLLAIPLAKYLIAAKFNFQSWFQAHWVDILTITFIFGYAFLRWIFVYYELEEDCIIAHTGYFGITRTKVYFAEISSLSLSQGYISRLIHSCAVYIDTDAKSLQNADIMLTLKKNEPLSFIILPLPNAKTNLNMSTTQRKACSLYSLLSFHQLCQA